MSEAKPVKLISDEESEDDHSRRVIPEPLAYQTENEPQLDTTVRKQVNRHEMLRIDRQLLC